MASSSNNDASATTKHEHKPHVHHHLHIEEILEEVKHIHFPHRYILVFLGFFAFVNLYTMRVCLSFAIQLMSKEFDWSSSTQGYALSSFFLGYIITQVPGGILASKYGGKWVLGLGIFSTAILSILTPSIVTAGGIGALIVLRILEGIGEGVAFPSMHALFSLWAPIPERSRMTSTVYSGAYAGTILVYAISGSLTERWDWHAIFYLFGILGSIWFALWVILARSSPWTDKGISIAERSYILGTVPTHKEKLPVPWKAMFSQTSIWAIIIMNLCHNWAFYTLLTWLPSYFTKQLKETIVRSSLYSMVAYIAYFVFFNVAGVTADYFISKKHVRVTYVRKGYQFFAYIISMPLLVALGYVEDTSTAVVLMVFSVGGLAFAGSGFNCNHLDIAPQYAGILMGLSNFAGTIPGIISPTLTGVILGNKPDLQSWRVVFWICFAIYTFGIIVWLIFASGEKIDFHLENSETSKSEDSSSGRSPDMDVVEVKPSEDGHV